MRQDAVTKIERFMIEALLASPQVPLGVNVIRLADQYDVEGITAMAYSIVIRYQGSNAQVIREVPQVINRNLTFEITISAQSYLTQSGHDYALQMSAAVQNVLGNAVPVNTGEQIMTPLFMSSERFAGLTDSSHYVYTQIWELAVEEIAPMPPIDPCVWAGNCSYLFPACTIQEIKPGDVLFGNVIYTPVLPPPEGMPYDSEYCGVKVEGADLCYKYDDSQLFLENYQDYVLVSTETFDTSGEFLIVNIYRVDTGEFVRNYFASNCDCRKLIQIAGLQPQKNKNWLGGLWRSPIGQAGNPEASGGPEPLPAVLAAKNGFGYVNTSRAYVYEDPRDPLAAKATVRYGRVFRTLEGVELEDENGDKYWYIGGTPIGKAWVRQDQFIIIKYQSLADECALDDIQVEDDEGKIDSCD